MTYDEARHLQVGDVYGYRYSDRVRTVTNVTEDRVYYIDSEGYQGSNSIDRDFIGSNLNYYDIITKSVMKPIVLQPGMILITQDVEDPTESHPNSNWIVFPTKRGLYAANYGTPNWCNIDITNMTVGLDKQKIYFVLEEPNNSIWDGDILWQREEETKELTVAEIEKLLGMNEGTLRIKK